jgi:hypothetical protein
VRGRKANVGVSAFGGVAMAKKKNVAGELITEETLQAVARIIGEHSAAAQVLRDIAERRARGEEPICFKIGNRYIVCDAKDCHVDEV